jgi:hypothetical protein
MSNLPDGTLLRFDQANKTMLVTGNLTGGVDAAQYVESGRSNCDQASISTFIVDATGIPAGDLTLGYMLRKAGTISAFSTGGVIGSLQVSGASADTTRLLSLVAFQVKLKSEWDMDGDTHHGIGNPYYFFLTTGGVQFSGIALRAKWSDFGVGVGGNGLVFGEWQLRWYYQDFATITIPVGYSAGAICAAVPIATLQLNYLTTWYYLPVYVLPVAKCNAGLRFF